MRALDNKLALVIGADAIGAGIALRFAREGASVALLDADIAAAQATARQIESAGGRAFAALMPWDGTAGAHVTQAIERLGGLHILVSNVLPTPEVAPLESQRDDAFRAAFARIRAAVAAMQAAHPWLRDTGCGRIVHVGHRYGENVGDAIGAYNAAAWSLVGIVRTAALDWGKDQIATNLLLPLADTPEFRRCHERRARVLDMMVGQLPLGRLGDPVEDIGAAALFLAGDACNFVNGEVIHGDGGQHVAGPVLNPARFS